MRASCLAKVSICMLRRFNFDKLPNEPSIPAFMADYIISKWLKSRKYDLGGPFSSIEKVDLKVELD